MKRMIMAAVLIIAISTAAFSKKLVAEGKTHTAMGNYKVELADNKVPMKGNDCTAYIISWENSPLEATVVICKERKCKRYVVLSDKLSIQYVCNRYYFGVEKLGKEFESEGYKTSDAALNRSEYFHQKVLTASDKTEVENTQLIAAYFPMLLNNATEAVASR